MQHDQDVLAGLVPLMQVRPELQRLCRYGGSWTVHHEPEERGWAPFHIVTEGSCLLETEDRPTIVLRAGDVALMPHGGRHRVRGNSDGPGEPLRATRRRNDDLLLISNIEGEADTQLICGRLRFEQGNDNVVLAALPEVIVLRGEAGPDADRARRQVELMRDELADDRIGAAAIGTQLANALMVTVLRAHYEQADSQSGVMALLGHRQTAKALSGMLAEPGKDWSLDELAELAATSRATLVRMFQKAVSMAPLTFLTELRLGLARHRLRTTDEPLAIIADAVGYRSEGTFSRAYRRQFGLAPGADRKGTLGAVASG